MRILSLFHGLIIFFCCNFLFLDTDFLFNFGADGSFLNGSLFVFCWNVFLFKRLFRF